jgi:hypothetical protein
LVSPEYSARKHHVPAAVGVNVEELALAVAGRIPALTGTGEPTALPPLAHPEALVSGPHTKKLTVPVGAPTSGSPVTVASSDTELPRVMLLVEGAELVLVVLAAVAL